MRLFNCALHLLQSSAQTDQFSQFTNFLQAKAATKPPIKKEATPSPAVKAEAVTSKPSNPVTAAEIRDYAKSRGGSIPAKDLSQHFKERLVVSTLMCSSSKESVIAFDQTGSCKQSLMQLWEAVVVIAVLAHKLSQHLKSALC